MAEFGPTGIEATSLAQWVEESDQIIKDALGEDVSVAPQTLQGQLSRGFRLFGVNIDELAVHVANGANINNAEGRQLTDMSVTLGIPFIQGQRSTVTCTCTGISGTVIPEGSRIRTSSGVIFRSQTSTLIPVGGKVGVLFRSEVIGPIEASAGTLTEIVDVVSGWTGVTNENDAVVGRNRETENEWVQRVQRTAAVHSVGTIESILARVLSVENVTHALVRDNKTNRTVTSQGIRISSGATYVAVKGGTDTDVAKAISDTSASGTLLEGGTSVTVNRDSGGSDVIRFDRIDDVALAITVLSTVTVGVFPSGGVATMRTAILEWSTSVFKVGETFDQNTIYQVLYETPGHTVTSVSIKRKEGGGAFGTPDLNEIFTLASADITITVS